MYPTRPHSLVAFLTVACLVSARTVLAEPSVGPIRTEDSRIAALMRDAARRSATFQSLVAALERTNGIVYVKTGRCGPARACLLHRISIAGPHRMLTIVVDPLRDDIRLIGAIAHELQHAIEVLGDTQVTTDKEVFAFYRMRGLPAGGLFETWAAVEQGEAVRLELRR